MSTRPFAPLPLVMFPATDGSYLRHRAWVIAIAVVGTCLALALATRTAADEASSLAGETATVAESTELATSALGGAGLEDTPLEAAELVAADQDDAKSRWDDVPLVLNGRGTRHSYRRIVFRDVAFKVYVAELYVPEPTDDPRRIIYEYPNVEIHFAFHRNVSPSDLRKSAAASFRKLLPSAQQARTHAENRDRFIAMMASTNLRVGDRVVVRFSDDSVEVLLNGSRRGVIESRDFQQLARHIWLGNSMPDRGLTELRRGLLNHRAVARQAPTTTVSAVGQ